MLPVGFSTLACWIPTFICWIHHHTHTHTDPHPDARLALLLGQAKSRSLPAAPV